MLDSNPSGLFEPDWCRNSRCSAEAAIITMGRIK